MNKKPTILFDGVCNLCNGSVRFIQKRAKQNQFRFLALQDEEGIKLLSELQIPDQIDSVILIQNNKAFTESDAIIEISKLLPVPWNWARIFLILPKKWRDGCYNWVAQNRYRWFGKRKTCQFN